jgi:hypothetical protein
MGKHARENVMVSAHELVHPVMVHAQLGFGLFKALFDCPAQTNETNTDF